MLPWGDAVLVLGCVCVWGGGQRWCVCGRTVGGEEGAREGGVSGAG
jgi:hypothetical protein